MLAEDNSQTSRMFGTLTQKDTMFDTASVWTGCVANIAEHHREEAKLVRGLDLWSAHISGARVQGSEFWVEGSGVRFHGSGFRVQGLGFWGLERNSSGAIAFSLWESGATYPVTRLANSRLDLAWSRQRKRAPNVHEMGREVQKLCRTSNQHVHGLGSTIRGISNSEPWTDLCMWLARTTFRRLNGIGLFRLRETLTCRNAAVSCSTATPPARQREYALQQRQCGMAGGFLGRHSR